MKKRKKRLVKLGILCGTVIILILGFKIKDYIENPLWYEFKGKLMKENRLIESISRSYKRGPNYTIWIYFENDQIDFDDVEPIFETFLKELNQLEFTEELFDYYEKNGWQYADMDVRFRLKGIDDTPFYYVFHIFLEFDNKESVVRDTWSLTDSTQEEYLHKKYRALDYK